MQIPNPRFVRASVALPLRSLLIGALIVGLGAPLTPLAAQAAGEDVAAAAFERRDFAEAAALWEERANQGDMEATSQLGNLYRLGLGVRRDPERARNLLRLAADAGVSEAQISLGLMHVKGEGLPVDAAEGARWIRRAADQGDAAGQYNLALLHENGLGVPRDLGQARRWLQSAA
ncbi:tetratricopeptide repeat protein, partial [Neomegalonema sp.]|uniref:tetratricopeptide repeat protein n=1 Tax=Neomegalonema sp. TaxID=2039713 RepID=UPI00260B6720